MIDEVGFLPVDTRQMFPQIDIIILGVCGTACPNSPPPQKKNKKKNQQFFAMLLQYLKKDVRESCPVMFVTCFLAQPGCRKFLPEDCNTLIKQQLCWERLPSLLSLLQDDAFQ